MKCTFWSHNWILYTWLDWFIVQANHSIKLSRCKANKSHRVLKVIHCNGDSKKLHQKILCGDYLESFWRVNFGQFLTFLKWHLVLNQKLCTISITVHNFGKIPIYYCCSLFVILRPRNWFILDFCKIWLKDQFFESIIKIFKKSPINIYSTTYVSVTYLPV